MLTIIGPAKTLDLAAQDVVSQLSQPRFMERSTTVMKALRQLNPDELEKRMKISTELAQKTYQYHKAWQPPFTPDNAKQALLAFRGAVFFAMKPERFKSKAFAWAQDHMRILSGLYGCLRPLDLIQPYRLEMGLKLKTPRAGDLYQFWGDTVTEAIHADLRDQGDDTLINLASKEYTSVLRADQLDCQIITPIFKQKHNEGYRVVTVYAKMARGVMAGWIMKKEVNTLRRLKGFKEDGYSFNTKLTAKANTGELIFTRDFVPEPITS